MLPITVSSTHDSAGLAYGAAAHSVASDCSSSMHAIAVCVPLSRARAFSRALEAVGDSGRPSGEVLDEVRRGYLWNGRVLRYAQVRVAKS